MIFAGMFNAGDIQYLLLFFSFNFFRRSESIVNNGNFFFRNVPVFYQIICSGATDSDNTLCFADIVRQNFFDIKHTEFIIFDRNMILRQIVHHRNREYRITAEYTAVGSKHNAEIKLFPVYPQRQNKKTVQHGKKCIAFFYTDEFKTFKLFCSVIFNNESKFMPGIFQRLHNLSYINGNTGFAVIKRNC